MIYIAYMKNDISASAQSARDRARLERYQAYFLLGALYERIYSKEPPMIEKDKRGKPHFVGEGAPSFSISHTEGMSLAVIATEGGSVGCDAQARIGEDVAARVGRRYPYVLSIAQGSAIEDAVILEGLAAENEIALTEVAVSLSGAESFTAKWALTEAILKAEGGGFRSASELAAISGHKSLSFDVDGECFCAVALLPKP